MKMRILAVPVLAAACTGRARGAARAASLASVDPAIASMPPGATDPLFLLDGRTFTGRRRLPELPGVRFVDLYLRYGDCSPGYRVDGECPPVVAITAAQ